MTDAFSDFEHLHGKEAADDARRANGLPTDGYARYRRTQIAEMARWTPGFNMEGVSISVPDKEAGSPKEGDMIARNPKNHADKWLVAQQYFSDNFEPL